MTNLHHSLALAVLLATGVGDGRAAAAASPCEASSLVGFDSEAEALEEHAAGAVRWEDLELPAHFVLDLESGVVSSRSTEDRPTMVYSAGRLHSDVPLRALPWNEGLPRAEISRDLGDLVAGVDTEVGRELVFDLYGEAWGYLRVIEASDERVRLEYIFEPDKDERSLRRSPRTLSARSGASGVQLTWPAKTDALYRVDRRPLPQSGSTARSEWTELQRVSGGSWFDERADSTQLAEYRVCNVAVGVGARARGVGDFAPMSELLSVGAHQTINLLSGRTDDKRVDLEVEYIRATGVQLLPGPGVVARVLLPAEAGEWELPELSENGYPRQRLFLAPGRVLGLRLAEGAYARVRVLAIEGDEVTLGRQINLDGGRTFPPVPQLEEAHWEAGRGVVLRLVDSPQRPPTERSGFLIEREEADGSWVQCARGGDGILELTDASQTDELLVRYRFRRWLGESLVSPTSAPVAVLIGDDGGAGGEALLARALEELGDDDFARRGRAREVLVALGERSWPGLREALRSENVELAEAARELLMTGVERAPSTESSGSGDLAGLLLGVRAEELGAGSPPHSDWTDPSPVVRASAALRATGWRETNVERVALWRRVLAEVDLDERVRLAATMAGSLQREGLGPDLRQAAPGSEPWLSATVDAPLQPHPSSEADFAGGSRWAMLAALQAWHDLAHSARSGADSYDLALERYDLAKALVAQFERGADELFLESALRVTSDPLARLRAALDLLSIKHEGADEDQRVVRLERADTELLAGELDDLKRDAERALLIILPAGTYEPLPDGRQIVAERGHFTLRAEGPVVVRSGFTLMHDCQGVIEGVEIAPTSSIALNLVQSDARLEDCVLRAPNVAVMGTDSTVELLRSVVVPAESSGSDAAGIRLSGRSMLLASETRIEAHGVAIYGARAALLDSCAVISHKRNALEGNGEGEVWAVGSLLSGAKLAVARVNGGVLDGVVALGGESKPIQAGPMLRLCVEHLWQRGDLADVDEGNWLDACALHR